MRLQILLWLQGFQVAILVLHDWIPIPPLNDIQAARRVHPPYTMALGTLISGLFPALGLGLSFYYMRAGWPTWLLIYLLAAYGFLFVGELEAWWIPCLVRPQPKRAADYAAMFGNTWSFLPERNGIRINALHFILHAATAATLLVLVSYFVPGT